MESVLILTWLSRAGVWRLKFSVSSFIYINSVVAGCQFILTKKSNKLHAVRYLYWTPVMLLFLFHVALWFLSQLFYEYLFGCDEWLNQAGLGLFQSESVCVISLQIKSSTQALSASWSPTHTDLFTEDVSEATRWILKWTGVHLCSDSAKWSNADWMMFHSTEWQWRKTRKPGVFEVK